MVALDHAARRVISETGITNSVASAGRFRSWGATHCGAVRTYNEDAFVNRPDLGLWVVADGAGGHEAGAVASGEVVRVLELLPPGLPAVDMLAAVRAQLDAAHAHLRAEAARRGPDAVIATTVVVLLARDDHFACLWAGDSRAYLLRDGHIVQVTRDHSLVQDLVDSGVITMAEAERHPHANVITRAVGVDGTLELEKRSGELRPGDRLLVCSDGLTKCLPDLDIGAMLAADEDTPAERMVLAALAAKVNDNVTAVAVQVLSGDARGTPSVPSA